VNGFGRNRFNSGQITNHLGFGIAEIFGRFFWIKVLKRDGEVFGCQSSVEPRRMQSIECSLVISITIVVDIIIII